MATAAIVLSKTRQALAAYLTAQNITGLTIYDGKGSSEKAAPCAICNAASATEDIPGTGNFWVAAEITLKTVGAVDSGEGETDPHTASEEFSTAVANALFDSDLAASLSADLVDEFHCFGIGGETEHESGEDGDCWAETWRFRLLCCVLDLE
jgi:hypothetical protein